MDKTYELQILHLTEKIIGYLPSFVAGLLLIILGWAIGWFAKRVIIQLALLLRLDRYVTRFRWGSDFAKGDVRYGFYDFIGNIVYLIVFLIFLDNAFTAWKLTFLSNLLEKGILLFPRLSIALLIFGVGYLLATWAGKAIQRSLRREHIARASLISRFAKASLILFFSSMALTELNIARQIVLIGFSTIIITLGAVTVVFSIIGGKELLKTIQDALEDEKQV
jgi:hypothetical protein